MSRENEKVPTAQAAALVVQEHGAEIVPGSYIPPETIEKVLGVKRHLQAYTLAVMKLKEGLEAYVEKTTGRRLWIRQSDAGLRFLTTSEAGRHYAALYSQGKRKMELAHAKAEVVVNPYLEEMSDSERQRYQETRHVNARILLHMKEAELDDEEEKETDAESR